MALNLDPITGLPSDFLAPDLYQIPLNSRPQLAPEWSPDHLPPNALHPDNMPSMFATVQAQNQLNPGLPQALTTDGAGNLNVNMKAGGGGGGGGTTPYGARNAVSKFSTSGSPSSDMYIDFAVIPTTLWRAQASVGLNRSSVNTDRQQFVTISFEDQVANVVYQFATVILIQNPLGTGLNVVDVQTVDIMYPAGWTNLPFIVGGSTSLLMHFRVFGDFCSIVTGTIEYS